MHPRWIMLGLAGLVALGACAEEATEPKTPSSPDFAKATSSGNVGINVVLKSKPTGAQLAQLNAVGRVRRSFPEINGFTLQAPADRVGAVRALSFVKGAAIDRAVEFPPPADLVPVSDFSGGISSWDQDAIDVTVAPGSSARAVAQTGEGVYVGILDSGLLYTWPEYFPEERIATQYARAIVGGGANDRGSVVALSGDQWQHDVCAHGTHVTSTILGYRFDTTYIQGTAPKATVIPVQMHVEGSENSHNSCSFFNSITAAGLLYFAELKRGPLAGHPLVVNNSWGGDTLDPLLRAAVDYTLAQGVLLVFSAGNSGDAGMSYPAAYSPVISVAASGWVKEWTTPTWWRTSDVAEPTNPNDFYVADFSSRAKAGQDLDIAAPGSWIVGPFQTQRGKASYFYLGGTSMAAPHVTGTVALMLQKRPSLTEAQAESILESTATPIGAGCRNVLPGFEVAPGPVCWGAEATGAGLLNAAAAVAATP